jgi:hypothetical protein
MKKVASSQDIEEPGLRTTCAGALTKRHRIPCHKHRQREKPRSPFSLRNKKMELSPVTAAALTQFHCL